MTIGQGDNRWCPITGGCAGAGGGGGSLWAKQGVWIVINTSATGGIDDVNVTGQFCIAGGCISSWDEVNQSAAPHSLNGSQHTGNLSSVRVIKDTGTHFISLLLDSILDTLFDRDVSINHTKYTDAEARDAVNGSGINASGFELARIGDSTFSTVQDLQNIYHSVGWVNGGNITTNETHINISGGTGLIRGTDSRINTIFYFDWSGVDNQLIPVNVTRYIGIEYNAGSPQIVIKTSDTWDYQTDFPIGTVVRDITGIHILPNPQAIGDHASFMVIRSYQTMPFARDVRNGGLVIGTNGLNMTMTAGTLWDRLNSFPMTSKDTSGSDTFDRYYRDGGGGFKVEQGADELNNSKYDDGSGTLASLINNRYTVQYFYIEADDELVSVYGTSQYTTLGAAEEDGIPTSIPDRLSKHGRLIGRVIIREGASIASSVESLFPPIFAGAAVTVHGDLAGLSDDDHIQYLLADGTRVMSGNLDMDNNEIKNAILNFSQLSDVDIDNEELIQSQKCCTWNLSSQKWEEDFFSVAPIDVNIRFRDHLQTINTYTSTTSGTYNLTSASNSKGLIYTAHGYIYDSFGGSQLCGWQITIQNCTDGSKVNQYETNIGTASDFNTYRFSWDITGYEENPTNACMHMKVTELYGTCTMGIEYADLRGVGG